ncbi:MAG: Hint domain-containing protein [Pseudomonadota bacterium]
MSKNSTLRQQRTEVEPEVPVLQPVASVAAQASALGALIDLNAYVTPSETRAPTIEDIICFTPGTRILTQYGDRPVETLRTGDMVVTRDQGLRPLKWVGSRTVCATGNQAPVRVKTLDGQGLLLSPKHRVLYTGATAELLFDAPEVLVEAGDLVDGIDVVREDHAEIVYIHLVLDHHEVIYANGMATESLYLDDGTLGLFTDAQRSDLFDTFPHIRSTGYAHAGAARTSISSREAANLLERSRKRNG